MKKKLTVPSRASNIRRMMLPRLGDLMRMARGHRTLRDMAELTGIDFSLLHRIESNKVDLPRRETLLAIADGYGLDPDLCARAAYLGEPAAAAVSLAEAVTP